MARPAKPWYRTAEDCWFVTLNGTKTNLFVRGRANEATAWKRFHELLDGSKPKPPTPTLSPDPQPVTAPAPKNVTVREVVAAFLLDAAERVEAETLSLYRLFLNGYCVKHGDKFVSDLTCPEAEAYSRKPNWNASTRSAFLSVLVRAFRFAERSRLIDRSPYSTLVRPTVGSRAADVLLTAEQFQKLCDVSPLPFRTFLKVLWLTGCRPNEAAQLTAEDIDWEAGTATIRKHKTKKAGKRRIVYLSPDAVSLLRELAERHPAGYLLRNRIGAKWTKVTTGAAMRTARKKAKLPNKILYGLRHSFATDALAAGVPDAQVAELLGHSSTAMLHKHYSHLGAKSKEMNDAVKRVR